MKTNSIPAMIMLLGGAIACILGIKNHYQTTDFLTMLLVVLVIFYAFGCVIKILIEKNITSKVEEIDEEDGLNEETKENIESEMKDDE